MHPDFAKVVDPVFAYVLNLLSRIEQSASNPPVADTERDLIKQQLNDAEKRLPGGRYSDQWDLSKYALVAYGQTRF